MTPSLPTVQRSTILFATFAISLAVYGSVRAERPACQGLLPSETLAYVQIADVKELVERFDETSIGRILKDQQLRPLTAQLFLEAEIAFSSVAGELGLTIEELTQIPQGEITLAVVAPPDGPAAVVLMMDVNGQVGNVQKVWDLAERSLQSEMKKTTEDVYGTRLTVFTRDDPPSRLAWFQKDALQVFCTNRDVALDILAVWNGESDQTVLNQNVDFTDMMRRSSGPRNASPQIRWFVDPIRFAKVASRGNFGAQTALAVLPVVGADGLMAVGGSATLATDEYDYFVQAHMITAGPRTGVLAMLAMKNGDPQPEAWVPHDVASYQTAFWDIESTVSEFEALYNSFRGPNGFQNDFVEWANQEYGTDLISEIRYAWGGRLSISSWYERPTRLNGAAYLGGIKLKEKHDFASALSEIIQSRDDVAMVTYGGVEYYAAAATPPEVENGAEDTPSDQFCFGIVDGYLLFANRPGAFERGIVSRRQGAKSLENELDFKLTASKLSRQAGGQSPKAFMFSRPEEDFRVMYELATAESTRDSLASQSVDNPLLGSLHRALNEKPLPPFEVFRKYFAATGSIVTGDESGFHFTSIGLRRK